MKKEYSKPGIIIEDFNLCQNIAGGCGAAHESNWGSPTHWNKTSCGWSDGVDIIWAAVPPCTEEGLTDVDADFDGICYNHPSNGMTIFSS